MKKFHCIVCSWDGYFPEYRHTQKDDRGVSVRKDYAICPKCFNDFREKDLY